MGGAAADIGEVVGRQAELAAIEPFLDGVSSGFTALVLEGEPGIGKTTLWKEGLAFAAARSYRVLSCRPAKSETRLSFQALGDLLEPCLHETLPVLSEPQRHALEVALLRAEPKGPPPNRRAVSVSVLNVIRDLARAGPVILGIDDVQWLDASSAGVLEFVLRRLGQDPVGLLCTERVMPDEERIPLELAQALPADRLHLLRLGPLSPAGLYRLLASRLGTDIPRSALLRLHEASGGNPLFALEMARVLIRRGMAAFAAPGEPVPVPDNLRDLVRDRLGGLPARAREAALIASALAKPTVELIEAAMSGKRGADAALARTAQAGVLDVRDHRVMFTHPLLASVLYSDTSREQRRELHHRLAGLVHDPEERARHLALAATGPDPDVASALDQAGRKARGRGAPEAAAELFEMARRLTPPDRSDDLLRRTVSTADCLFDAGDTARSRRLLDEVVASAPPGPVRAGVLRRLGRVRYFADSWRGAADDFGQALVEADDDLPMRAGAERDVGFASMGIGDIRGALEHARAGLDLAETLDDQALLAQTLAMVGVFEFVLAHGFPQDLMERALTLEPFTEHLPMQFRPSFSYAIVLKWADRFEEARRLFEALRQTTLDRGDESSLPFLLYHLGELECWAGNLEIAARYAREAEEAAVQTGQEPMRATALYTRALVDAHLGHVEAARKAAEEGLILGDHTAAEPAVVLNMAALGFLELSLGDPAAAHGRLRSLIDRATGMGILDPGVLRFLADEIEALVAIGQLDEAEALLGSFEKEGKRLDRPWALATGARCRGILTAARGDLPEALSSLQRALEDHERLSQPLERGRTLLVLGQVYRRAKQKRLARDSLEESQGIFDRLGAALWSRRAAREVTRIGGRPPGPFDLTATERRVAELIAQDKSNREIAEALFISEGTVETNLGKIYRKLGIRSRAGLARWVADRERPANGPSTPTEGQTSRVS